MSETLIPPACGPSQSAADPVTVVVSHTDTPLRAVPAGDTIRLRGRVGDVPVDHEVDEVEPTFSATGTLAGDAAVLAARMGPGTELVVRAGRIEHATGGRDWETLTD